jgi:hypothetical protein
MTKSDYGNRITIRFTFRCNGWEGHPGGEERKKVRRGEECYG